MRLLGISAKKEGGKDTLGRHLTDSNLFHYVIPMWFATPGKNFLHKAFGVPRDCLWGTNEQKNRPTNIRWRDLPHFDTYILRSELGEPHAIAAVQRADQFLTGRELMQEFLENTFEKIPGVWVRLFKEELREAKQEYDSKYEDEIAIVMDVRRPNEVDAIHEEGGKVIRLLRAPHDKTDRFKSETFLDPENYDPSNFDAVIDNRFLTPEETWAEAQRVLRNWGWF